MKNVIIICLVLFVLIIVSVILQVYYGFGMKEGLTNLMQTVGIYPTSENGFMLSDFYPIAHTGVTKNNVSDIWWHYPIFEVGSYKQITNNIKYPNNPDVGQCRPSEFCGTYHENQLKSNYIEPLPPVPYCPNAVRVNYYNS